MVDVGKRKADALAFMRGLFDHPQGDVPGGPLGFPDKWFNVAQHLAAVLRFLPAMQESLLSFMPPVAHVLAFDRAKEVSVLALQALAPSVCTRIRVVEDLDRLIGPLGPGTLESLAQRDLLMVTSEEKQLALRNFSALVDLSNCIKLMPKLELLDLTRCTALKLLPKELVELEHLIGLDISGCERLASEILHAQSKESANSDSTSHGVADVVAELRHLKRFALDDWDGDTALVLLQVALNPAGADGAPTNLSKSLESLRLRRCRLKRFPTISVPALTKLCLEGCELEKVSLGRADLGSCAPTLRELDLTGCRLQSLDLSGHSALSELILSGCTTLDFATTVLPPELAHLRWDAGSSNLVTAPPNYLPPSLRTLSMRECRELQALPEDLERLADLEVLDLSYCVSLDLGSGSKLPTSLTTLRLFSCGRTGMPRGIDQLRLKVLDLGNCASIDTLDPLASMSATLEWLDISGLAKLEALPELAFAVLKHLNANGLKKLKTLPEQLTSCSPNLEVLGLSGAALLKEVPPVDNLGRLRRLTMDGCGRLRELPKGFGHLKSLAVLEIRACRSLRRLPSELTSLPAIESLILQGCTRLEELPRSIGMTPKLAVLVVWRCECLRSLPDSLNKCDTLWVLDTDSCTGIVRMPDLSTLQGVKYFENGVPLIKRWGDESGNARLLLEANAEEKVESDKMVRMTKAETFARELKELPRDEQLSYVEEQLRADPDIATEAMANPQVPQAVLQQCASQIARLLKHDGSIVRAAAAKSLGRVLPAALRAHTANLLQCFMTDSDEQVRMYSACALCSLPSADFAELAPDLLDPKLFAIKAKEHTSESMNGSQDMSIEKTISTLAHCATVTFDEAVRETLLRDKFTSLFAHPDRVQKTNLLEFASSVPSQLWAAQVAEIAQMVEAMRIPEPKEREEKAEDAAFKEQERLRFAACSVLARVSSEDLAKHPAALQKLLLSGCNLNPFRCFDAYRKLDSTRRRGLATALLKKLEQTIKEASQAKRSAQGSYRQGPGRTPTPIEVIDANGGAKVLIDAGYGAKVSEIVEKAIKEQGIHGLDRLSTSCPEALLPHVKAIAQRGGYQYLTPQHALHELPTIAPKEAVVDRAKTAELLERLRFLPRRMWSEAQVADLNALQEDTQLRGVSRPQSAQLLSKLTVSDLGKVSLDRLLHDKDSIMRSAALRAVRRLELSELLPRAHTLMKLLDQAEARHQRVEIVRVLTKLAPHDDTVMQRLRELMVEVIEELADPNQPEHVRQGNLDVLGRLPRQLIASNEALAAIHAALDEEEPAAISAAASAIEALQELDASKAQPLSSKLARLSAAGAVRIERWLIKLPESVQRLLLDESGAPLIEQKMNEAMRRFMLDISATGGDAILREFVLCAKMRGCGPTALADRSKWLHTKMAPIVEQLDHLDPRTRACIPKMLAQFDPTILEGYVDALIRRLSDPEQEHWTVVRSALAALEKLHDARPQPSDVVQAMDAAREVVLQGRFAEGFDEEDEDD